MNIPLIQKELDKAEVFPVELHVTIVGGRNFNNMTKNDIDNVKKPTCDLLVKAGILPDDEKQYINFVSVKFLPSPTSKGEPLTVIEYIEPEPEENIEWTAPYPWDKS
jgi:Holliday junction resolvase RusA-like endonuclease